MRRQKDAYGSPKRFGSMTLLKLQRAQFGPPLGSSLVIEACSDHSSRNLKGRSRYPAPLEPCKQIQQLCHARDLFRRQHDRVLLNLCDIIQRRCYIKKKKSSIFCTMIGNVGAAAVQGSRHPYCTIGRVHPQISCYFLVEHAPTYWVHGQVSSVCLVVQE